MNSMQLQHKEKTAQYLWTALILMFFMIQAVIWTVAISATSRDSSHAVVADYDKQAFHWDEVKKQQKASKALGWVDELKVDSGGDILGNRSITLSLLDRSGQPIENASIEVKAFHRGQAAEVQTILLTSVTAGIYSSKVQIQRSGRWQFSGTAVAGDDKFIIDREIELRTERK